MNTKNILFPTDFSEYNEAALLYATRLAAESGAKIHFLHIHDTRDLGATMGEVSYVYNMQWEKDQVRLETDLQKLLPSDSSVPYEHHLGTGIPDAEIVRFANDNHVDLIVMASHGRTGLRRLVMGSVAEAVMRRACCPVLVVKQPEARTILDQTADLGANATATAADASA